jgi:hypothetical protein
MRRMVWLLLMTAVSVAGAARATPPQVVGVMDMLFGANESHIFLLRSLDDNMGRHGVVQTDVLLVARNRATNADEDIWPVARSIDYGAYFADFGRDGRVQTLALSGAVNPFDIAAAQGAWLMLGQSGRPAADQAIAVSQEAGALVLADDRTPGTYRLAFADLSTLLEGNLARTRDVLPAYFAEGGTDALVGLTFDPAADCRFDGFLQIPDGAAKVTWLAEVTCQNDTTMAPVSTYVVIRPG